MKYKEPFHKQNKALNPYLTFCFEFYFHTLGFFIEYFQKVSFMILDNIYDTKI